MNRATFLRLTGFGSLGTLPSCSALDNLDTSAGAVGTGLQFSGLIKVLAKYPATVNQKRTAQIRGSRAHVEVALKPAYEKRDSAIRAASEIRRRNAESVYRKQLGVAKRTPASGSQAPVAQVKEKYVKLQQKLETEAEEQLAAARAVFHSESRRITAGSYVPDVELSDQSTVGASTMREELLASRELQKQSRVDLLAVSVQKGGAPEEAKAADSIMVYNTKTSQLESDSVYVLGNKPKVGRENKFEGGFAATYVG